MRTIRGEFRRGDGLILPNNLSLYGSQAILTAWALGTVPTFWFGLVKGAPTATMTENDMQEPTLGLHSYQRVEVLRDTSQQGWPDFGNVGVENYIGTGPMQFVPQAGAFDKAIQRVAMFITNVHNPSNPVCALSAPLPDEVILDMLTPIEQCTFFYRLYL